MTGRDACGHTGAGNDPARGRAPPQKGRGSLGWGSGHWRAPVSMPFPLRHPLRPEPEPGQGGERTAACTPLTLQGFSGSG